MFYYNLSGSASQSILTSSDPDLALFPTLQSGDYWTGTQFDSDLAFAFDFAFGNEDVDSKSLSWYSWAVHSGNVGAVPIPAAVWLFGSGLLGLIGIYRRMKAA